MLPATIPSLSLSLFSAFSFGLTVPTAYDWPTRTDCSITFWPRVNALLMSGANDVVEETGTTGWVTADVCVRQWISSIVTFVCCRLKIQKSTIASNPAFSDLYFSQASMQFRVRYYPSCPRELTTIFS